MWMEDSLVMAMILQNDGTVGYWTALNYWGMADQISKTIFIQSVRRRFLAEKTILGIRFKFITITAGKVFGVSVVHIGGSQVRITDREKTIIDCLDRPDLSGGIKQLARIMRNEAPRLDWDRFNEYLARFPSRAVVKRAGYIIEATGVEIPERDKRIVLWRNLLKSGYVKLEPGAGTEGKLYRRWRIHDNVGLGEPRLHK